MAKDAAAGRRLSTQWPEVPAMVRQQEPAGDLRIERERGRHDVVPRSRKASFFACKGDEEDRPRRFFARRKRARELEQRRPGRSRVEHAAQPARIERVTATGEADDAVRMSYEHTFADPVSDLVVAQSDLA